MVNINNGLQKVKEIKQNGHRMVIGARLILASSLQSFYSTIDINNRQ